jgi:hypothetical protein
VNIARNRFASFAGAMALGGIGNLPLCRNGMVAQGSTANCAQLLGRDSMLVVDANLKVSGIENLRIADDSIMPRVTTGNTMAPCVIIVERAGEILKADYKL